jgi:hypothetical protein
VTAGYTTGSNVNDAGNTQVLLTDSANTYIGKTRKLAYAITRAAATNSVFSCLASSTVVNITSDTTYKLRLKRSDDAGTGTGRVFVSSSFSDAEFYATRIG